MKFRMEKIINVEDTHSIKKEKCYPDIMYSFPSNIIVRIIINHDYKFL